MELTIHELSARVGMTPRNIREWQTIGVLPPPRRRGRTAIYGEDHLARIERIKSLRADGFPLEVIRQYIDRSEESAADIRAVAAAVLAPASHSASKTMTRAALAEALGTSAEAHLVAVGLIEVSDGLLVIKDVMTFEYIEQLVGFGLTIEAVTDAFDALIHHQIAGVGGFVELYREVLWQPFVDAGLPAAQWSSIAETSGRMRELLIGLGVQTLRRATDVVIGQVAVQQATKLDGRG